MDSKNEQRAVATLHIFSGVSGKATFGGVGKVGNDDLVNLDARNKYCFKKNPNLKPSKRNFEWGSWFPAGIPDVDGSITHLKPQDGYLELWVEWDHMRFRESMKKLEFFKTCTKFPFLPCFQTT